MKNTILLSILLAFLATPLYGQNPYADFERELDLSPPQRAQIEAIRNKYTPEWEALNRESMRKRMEIRELRQNRRRNAPRIEKLQGELRGFEMVRDNLYTQYRWEITRNLNERQRRQFDGFCDWERGKMGTYRHLRHRDYDR